MSGDEPTILDRIREFERTFEQKYGRKMTAEECDLLEAARQNIQQKLESKYSE